MYACYVLSRHPGRAGGDRHLLSSSPPPLPDSSYPCRQSAFGMSRSHGFAAVGTCNEARQRTFVDGDCTSTYTETVECTSPPGYLRTETRSLITPGRRTRTAGHSVSGRSMFLLPLMVGLACPPRPTPSVRELRAAALDRSSIPLSPTHSSHPLPCSSDGRVHMPATIRDGWNQLLRASLRAELVRGRRHVRQPYHTLCLIERHGSRT